MSCSCYCGVRVSSHVGNNSGVKLDIVACFVLKMSRQIDGQGWSAGNYVGRRNFDRFNNRVIVQPPDTNVSVLKKNVFGECRGQHRIDYYVLCAVFRVC